jgi:hypothetical protein
MISHNEAPFSTATPILGSSSWLQQFKIMLTMVSSFFYSTWENLFQNISCAVDLCGQS